VLTSIGNALLHGVVGVIWLDQADGGYRRLASPPWLFELLGGVSPTTLWPMVCLVLASSVMLTIGLGGRVTAFVLLQSYLAVSHINWHTRGCDDQLIGNALWLLVLGRSTATLSVDCRIRTGSWRSDVPVAAWPRYLAVFQLVLVYWTTGLQKVSIHWNPGGGFSALYYILQEPSWQRWDLSWLAWVYPLTQVATALTWFWEMSAPLLLLALWYRATSDRPGRLRAFFNWLNFRRLFVVVGVAMHLCVFVLIGLGPFTWITLSFYVCLFRPDEWRAAGNQIRRIWVKNPSDGLPDRCREMSAEMSRPAWWVVALVTFHVVAVTLMALPAPAGAMDREDWESPLAQEEFAAWADRLSSWGLSFTPGELEDDLWKAAQGYMAVREWLLAPFQPYYQLCGTRQGWRMFVGPNLTPTRLHIDVRQDGNWRPVYVERDPTYHWLGRKLDHEHLRTAIFTMVFFKYERELGQFARWVAAQAAVDFPRADRVRVRLEQFRTPAPEQVRAHHRPTSRIVAQHEILLAEFKN
jgi:hypothetical protein